MKAKKPTISHLRDRRARAKSPPLAIEKQLKDAQRLAMAGRQAVMSVHELNNYLAIVQGNAGLLDESLPQDHPERRLLNALLLGVDRAVRMSRHLRNLAKASQFDPRRVDLAECVGTTFMMMEQTTSRVLTFERKGREALFVSADENWLDQILVNLVLNAADATRPGGRVRIRVGRVRAGRRRGWCFVEVEDWGVGIPVALRRKMKELFFTTKAGGRGTGIGLALACELIDKMGGVLVIRSREGTGSTFRVMLPPVRAGRSDQAV